jgi:hypothetical protein
MAKGYRKLVMFMIAAAVAALAPLTDNQAMVMETLIWAAIGANAVEHVGGAVREGMAARRSGARDERGGVRTGEGS